jgi:hypothetical protein
VGETHGVRRDIMDENKIKPIDIINNIEATYTPQQIERAWVGLISAQPPIQWLKNTNPAKPDNEYMKQGGKLIPYMPIEILEMLMDKLLMFPKIKITNSGLGQIQTDDKTKTLAYMNIELEYYNHGKDEWAYTSGTASMEVTGKFKWDLVFPKLKAEAYKNACKSIGNLFGRRIGREDMVMTEDSIAIKKKDKILTELNGGAK